MTQVSQLPLACLWVALGRDRCPHPPLILRVSVVSALTGSNQILEKRWPLWDLQAEGQGVSGWPLGHHCGLGLSWQNWALLCGSSLVRDLLCLGISSVWGPLLFRDLSFLHISPVWGSPRFGDLVLPCESGVMLQLREAVCPHAEHQELSGSVLANSGASSRNCSAQSDPVWVFQKLQAPGRGQQRL